MANCFREISEFDDTARSGLARGSSNKVDVNESFVHSTVDISPLQACHQMNIKDTMDCLSVFVCLLFLGFIEF